jgi:hypothetical protein
VSGSRLEQGQAVRVEALQSLRFITHLLSRIHVPVAAAPWRLLDLEEEKMQKARRQLVESGGERNHGRNSTKSNKKFLYYIAKMYYVYTIGCTLKNLSKHFFN